MSFSSSNSGTTHLDVHPVTRAISITLAGPPGPRGRKGEDGVVEGIPDHGALPGLEDDDHEQYALADGTRGEFASVAAGEAALTAVQPGVLVAAIADLLTETEADSLYSPIRTTSFLADQLGADLTVDLFDRAPGVVVTEHSDIFLPPLQAHYPGQTWRLINVSLNEDGSGTPHTITVHGFEDDLIYSETTFELEPGADYFFIATEYGFWYPKSARPLGTDIDLSNYVTQSQITDFITESDLVGLVTEDQIADFITSSAIADMLTQEAADLLYDPAGSATAAVAAVIGASTTALNTLVELGAALGNNPNFASDVLALIGTKASSSDLATLTSTVSGHTSTLSTLGSTVSAHTTAIAGKADSSTMTTALAAKADASSVATSLAAKADASAVATSLASKADASTVSTISSAVTAMPETIRDMLATALVAGANITITPNDGADTITIAATGGGTVPPITDAMIDAAGLSASVINYDDTEGGTGVQALDVWLTSETVKLNDTYIGMILTNAAYGVINTELGGGTISELIRDVAGATLVAGTNVTITPNDAGDTITISATGGSVNEGDLLMKADFFS